MQHHRDLIAAGALALCASGAAAQTYHAVALPGTAAAMSSCGWVTGNVGATAFIFHDGVVRMLPTTEYHARSVNNYGDVNGYAVGGKVLSVSTAAVTLFGADGAHGIYSAYGWNSTGTGLNDAVAAVGVASPLADPAVTLPFTFFNGKTTTLEKRNNELLSGINNSGQIVGTLLGPAASRVFIYNGSYTYPRIGGATSTAGNAINDAGDVVGQGLNRAGVQEGFLYANGTGQFIGLAGNAYNHASSLVAMNNTGVAVGSIAGANGATHAMLYAAGGITDLNDVSDAPEPLVSAVGVGDGGEIAANAASGVGYLLVPGGMYPPNACKTR